MALRPPLSPPVPPAVVSKTALVILAVVACGAVLYWLRGIFTPLALAIFLAIMIDGLVRLLNKHVPRLPRKAALPAALVISVLVLVAATLFVADNAQRFIDDIDDYVPRLNA